MAVKYRKKPVEIEAVQFTGENIDELIEFTGQPGIVNALSDGLTVLTLEGFKPLPVGYFVIKGVANEIYPCEPAIFHKTYELVDNDA